ncbi:hypothetical protein FCL47_18735 [Desulfopila sp. IMCC35006]|uniref:hypothetical protein n=1 Tax=Desulfopila sp. IMCC35006 TaxID=2569542 RepID=UPI0010AC05B7|nr:hypothetical protein [Desulfopila sp. IMCC35006]TKB24225.1 hypothetical protein FCL47_18735 [Desulfopila sp. IMCC35006]
MNDDIEIEMDIELEQFDIYLPTYWAEGTREGVQRAKYDPGKFPCLSERRAKYDPGKFANCSDRRSDMHLPVNLFSQRRSMILPENSPVEQVLKSNIRLMLGKLSFYIPPGFKPGSVKTVSHDKAKDMKLVKWRGVHPDPKQVEIVVKGILDLGVDEIRPGELTYPLRNHLKAAQIKRVFLFLVIHHGALEKVDSAHASNPTGGRPPGESYRILWGESEFFPQRPVIASKRINPE